MGFIAWKTTAHAGKGFVQPRTRTHFHDYVFMPIKQPDALTNKTMEAGAAGERINIDQMQDSHEHYPGPSRRSPSSDSM